MKSADFTKIRFAVAAAAVVAAVTIPSIWISLARETAPPPSAIPTIAPSETSSPGLRISVPGISLPIKQVSFVDAMHGWVLFSACDSEMCKSAVASTADGGQTWVRAPLPELPPRATVSMHPLNASSVTFYVIASQHSDDPVRSFLVTRDAGRTFQSHPYRNPPIEAMLAAPDGERGNPYRVRCAGGNGYEDGANGISCQTHDLVKLGAGAIAPRPQLLWKYGGAQVKQGGDGRLWLITGSESVTEIAVSADQGKTWKSLPSIQNPWVGLALSRDGKETWYVAKGSMARLVNGQWQVQPGHSSSEMLIDLHPLGGGAAMVSYSSRIGIVNDGGGFEPFDIKSGGIEVLPDGTYAIVGDGYLYLGSPGNWRQVTWS